MPFAGYGSDAGGTPKLVDERPERAELSAPGLPYRAVEVVWAARHEAARTVEDVLARRTRALFLDARASIEAAPRSPSYSRRSSADDARWQETQVESFRALASRYLFGR